MRDSRIEFTPPRALAIWMLLLVFSQPESAQAASWSPGPDLPTSLVRGVAVYSPGNGRVYIMGGRSSDAAGSGRTTPLEYDPATNAWVSKAAVYPDNQINNMACGLLFPSSGPAQIYCVGGSAAAGTTATTRVFRYNTATDAITTTGMDAWPESVANTLPGGFTVFQNKLLILGGFHFGTGAMSNRIWQFDPTAASGSQWTLKSTTLPVPMGFIPTTTISTLVYTAGGSVVVNGTMTDSTNSYVYNPVANTIAALTNIPRATAETRALTVNDEMWVMGGGRTAPNPSNEVDIYNPVTGNWRVGIGFNVPRRNFAVANDGIRIWLAGGLDQSISGFNSAMEIFGTYFYGVNGANQLIRFHSSNPAGILSSAAITGMVSGDTIVGLDIRPANGELLGLGSGSRLYSINPTTGAATFRAGINNPFTGAPGLDGTSFGYDFDPVPDRIRIVSDTDRNLSVNPNTGAPILENNLAYDNTTADNDPIDPNAGLNPTITASAHTNSFFGSTSSVVYGIDTNLNILVLQDPAHLGVLNTIGPLGVNPNDLNGFDIDPWPDGTQQAFAAFSLNGAPSVLLSINLTTGAANQISPASIGGPGAAIVRGLAVVPIGAFQLSAPAYSQNEGGGNATVTVFRNGGTEGSVSVRFTTSNGTATSPADFTDSDQTLTFASGVASVVVSIPINNDSLDELNETINLALSNPTGGARLAPSQTTAVLTINDDDTAAIGLTKLTNGTDNNSPPGPTVPFGSPVTFTYVVSNAASDPLAGVVVRDDNGTPGDVADDFNASLNSGDGNNNGLLDPSETWLFNAGRIATAGQYTNIAVASGIPTGGGGAVQDSDADNHFGLAPPSSTPTPTPTPTPTGTPGPSPTPKPEPSVGLVGNVSTRLPVGRDDNVLIEGFIVLGPNGSTKKIMVRALGPFLTQFGVTDALPNPTLEIRDGSNTVVATNNDWRNTVIGGIITGDQAAEIEGSNLAPANDLESAIIANLAPGNYTAVVSGVNNTIGTGIVDAYDMSPASPARLANIATRGLIQPGDQLMIAGFIIQNGPVLGVIRAIGPSLSGFGINNALPDTTLQLRDQNGMLLRENDDWESDQKMALENSGLQPSNPKEAAIYANIPPGQYTVQVRGKPETTGIGVVEIYFLE